MEWPEARLEERRRKGMRREADFFALRICFSANGFVVRKIGM